MKPVLIDTGEFLKGAAQAPAPTKDDEIAADVVQRVCDYDDRNSPEDYPEMLMITGEELRDEVLRALAESREPRAGAAQVPKGCGGCGCDPSGSDGLKCPGPDGRLLCDPAGAAQVPSLPPHLHIGEMLRIYDEKGGDWLRIAREVEERTFAALSQQGGAPTAQPTGQSWEAEQSRFFGVSEDEIRAAVAPSQPAPPPKPHNPEAFPGEAAAHKAIVAAGYDKRNQGRIMGALRRALAA